jgi:uroporphyrin-III C-methyltransferase/precorrin-2 dehydrogenase/sirohydrochlorin ferrochelatase/precorrin-2 dehydrogenase/sirohydrochlorin ferrochelatase
MKVYPVFLIGLERKRCVVVGGDPEAERKTLSLLEREANVTVIAPRVTPTLERLSSEGRVDWIRRDYARGDLSQAFLVIASGGDEATREAIYREADGQQTLVNVVDDVSRCNCIAGSVVRRGPLSVAISTSGVAPALAVRLRERLERELGEEYATLLDWLEPLRTEMVRMFPDAAERRAAWYRIVDGDVLDLLRSGETNLARRRLAELVAS